MSEVWYWYDRCDRAWKVGLFENDKIIIDEPVTIDKENLWRVLRDLQLEGDTNIVKKLSPEGRSARY